MDESLTSLTYSVTRTSSYGSVLETVAVRGGPDRWLLSLNGRTESREASSLPALVLAERALHEVRPGVITEIMCPSLTAAAVADNLTVVEPTNLEESAEVWDERLYYDWVHRDRPVEGIGDRAVAINGSPAACAPVDESGAAVVVPLDGDHWRFEPAYDRIWGSFWIIVTDSMASGLDTYMIGQVSPRLGVTFHRPDEYELQFSAWRVEDDSPGARIRMTVDWFRSSLGEWGFDRRDLDSLLAAYVTGGLEAYQGKVEELLGEGYETELSLLVEPGDVEIYVSSLEEESAPSDR